MGDMGEVKARVTIEYDGSGVDKAKEDLQSLAEIAGGSLADGTNSANDALSGLDEQMGKSAESTRALTSSVGAMEKPLAAGEGAITSVTDALGEHQSAIEDAGSAYEALQRPIEDTTALLEDASPSMIATAQHAESLQENLGNVSDEFSSMGQSVAQTAQVIPTFSDHMQNLSEEFDPKAFGLDTFTENMGVFQDALSNPEPFSMIQQHLKETGQTWDDFSSSIGSDNTDFLQGMAENADVSHKVLGGVSADVQATGQAFYESAAATDEYTKQFNSMADTVGGASESMGGSWGEGSVGDLFGGVMDGLNKVAMPIMAVQMIGMAVGAASTGIYNMAALAEGPAAHSVGTFTGAIDLMGQHAQTTAEQFSEGFGKGILPTLDAMNSVASQNNDGNFFGGLGGFLGTNLGALGDVAQILGGGLVGGAAKTLTLNPNNTIGNDWVQSGWEGLQNTWANITGAPEPFPGPANSASSQANVNMPQIQQQLAQSAAQMNAQANDPTFLAAQAYLGSQTQIAQQAQLSYSDSHYGGTTGPMDPLSNVIQAELNPRGYGGTPDPNAAFFNSIQTPDIIGQGCFPAGTRVLLADSSTRPIEALQVGESVLAHNGTKQVVTTVLALIKPPPRLVYELTFDTGNTLTLTDSHPIATLQGWKSLSPDATHKENPDLVVTALLVGDRVQTIDGLCTLESIGVREVVQIYNITVDEPHTFYANGVLVHNKMNSIMQQVADTTIPTTDLSRSNLISSLASNFSSADLTHTFTATVNWAANGLSQNFLAEASWAAQGLAKDFLAEASWAAQGLEKDFLASANWAAQGLSQAYTAIASWSAQNLEKPFIATAQWAAQGLEHAFEGVVSWFASGGLQHTFEGAVNWVASGGLQHTFEGITDWIGQNLEHTFTGVASWIGQNLNANILAGGMTPGFASGVQNYSGGLAVVGESGPELVYLPQGSSVYPHSSGFTPINSGSSNSGEMMMVNLTHITQLDGKTLAQETIPYIAPMIRQATGRRS